jgi:hypothetical protein
LQSDNPLLFFFLIWTEASTASVGISPCIYYKYLHRHIPTGSNKPPLPLFSEVLYPIAEKKRHRTDEKNKGEVLYLIARPPPEKSGKKRRYGHKKVIIVIRKE